MAQYPERSLIVLIGAPGAGKTTWAEKNLPNAKRVSLEVLRTDPTAKPVDVVEEAILKTFELVQSGNQVYFDSTGVGRRMRARLLGIARRSKVPAYAVVFDPPLQTLLDAQVNRTHPVPADRVRELYQKLQEALPLIKKEGWKSVTYIDRNAPEGRVFHRDASADEVNDRQQSMIEELVSIAEEYGPFDTTTGANGAHYAPADANPFKSEGLICANCELYQPISDTEGRCAVVQGPLTDGNVDPNAICKLWVIPESKLAPAEGTREEVMKAEIRIVEERDLRENPDLLSELRNGADIVEKRRVETEVRADQTGKGWKLTGYAAVFDSETSLGNFNERIARGAFRKVLKRTDLDVAALFNHDQNLILGRTTNGTLTLREDPRGLVYEVDVADTSYGRDLKVLLERGDVTQSSFAFRVKSDGQQWTENQDGTLVRTITEFEDLLDVSPVVYPAYADTTSVALTRNNQTSSTRETEQEGQGSAEQQSSQAGSQPRRADEEGAHRQRVRRLKLRDRAA